MEKELLRTKLKNFSGDNCTSAKTRSQLAIERKENEKRGSAAFSTLRPRGQSLLRYPAYRGQDLSSLVARGENKHPLKTTNKTVQR